MVLSVQVTLGKELQESAGSFRKANIFGNDLGVNWPTGYGLGSNYPVFVSQVATTFDLSGKHPNHEVVTSLVYITGAATGAWTSTTTVKYPNGSTMISLSTSGSGFTSYWTASIIGYRTPEINQNGTYTIIETGTGAIVYNISRTFTITNCTTPSTFQLGTSSRGKIWDENGTIAFVDSDQYKHTIPTTSILSAPGAEDGQIWIDTSLGSGSVKLAMIHDGLQRRTNKTAIIDIRVSQPNAQPGHIWFDTFRIGGLNFIYSDGKRYYMSDGVFSDF